MTPADAAGRLLMIGAGNMGGAMLRRWLACGLDPAQVTVVSPSGRAMPPGVRVVAAIADDERFDTIVLAHKPHQLRAIVDAMSGMRAPRLLVSILAGVELATLTRLCSGATIVRAMPNLPVALGKGVVALHGDDPEGRAAALMASLGLVEWIADEAQFDLVTALAGSGPGFLYRYIDAMAQAAVALGLPADRAARLTLATVAGAAALAAEADVGPAVLADRVASAGGSTREGLDVLDADEALVRLLTATLAAATQRNAEMAAAARA